MGSGRAPSGQALAVPAEPVARLGPSGFDPSRIPDELPGHWETAEGAAMAREYATKSREELSYGHLTDLEVANAVFMAGRWELELIHYQQAAKERIRWLSAQLALARASNPTPPSDGDEK